MRRPIAAAVVLLALAGCAGPPLAPGQAFPVFFTNASVTPDEPAKAVIAAAATWALKYPSETIKVTGYADPRAQEKIAAELATRRADEVAGLLEEHGVSPDRIKRSTGDEALIGPAGPSGLGNRRVDISVGL